MPNSKQIVYLSQSQYAELIANGTITVDGVTVTYDENDIYVTPQAEPVTDVRVAGTSVSSNGVANIPVANGDNYGVIKVGANAYGLMLRNDGTIQTVMASNADMKSGSRANQVISPQAQHLAAFYGLAKAAGHDEKNSTEPLGTYTPEAKGAIQKMLGVSDLIATEENNLVASKAYAIGDIFTANGKLYKATAAIAQDAAIILPGEVGENCEETTLADENIKDVQVNGTSIVTDGVASIPIANVANKLGLVKTAGAGLTVESTGRIVVQRATNSEIVIGTDGFKPITPGTQHMSTFYGLAKAAGHDEKDSTNPVGTYTPEAKAAIRTMLGAVGSEDYATNGGAAGLIKIAGNGLVVSSQGEGLLLINAATATQVKSGASAYYPIVPSNQHSATFYGLAKAAGDTTQSSSANAVGTYTDNAKASIKAMLGIQDGSTGTVDVSGTTPTITAVENTRYVCGEVTSLSFTPPASGISIVRFTSGSTVTVLTIPSTVKFPEWFDPTSLETNTIYEICVTDGEFGAVMSWAL